MVNVYFSLFGNKRNICNNCLINLFSTNYDSSLECIFHFQNIFELSMLIIDVPALVINSCDFGIALFYNVAFFVRHTGDPKVQLWTKTASYY